MAFQLFVSSVSIQRVPAAEPLLSHGPEAWEKKEKTAPLYPRLLPWKPSSHVQTVAGKVLIVSAGVLGSERRLF